VVLAQSRSAGLREIEDLHGNVHLWPYDEATHMASSMLGIQYDPSTDYVATADWQDPSTSTLSKTGSTVSAAEKSQIASQAGSGMPIRAIKAD
jgi:hypothetical protein